MNERYIVAHLLTASANLDENTDDKESPEVAQQREQFKEIAKNTSVAKALRFVNKVGPFTVGTAATFTASNGRSTPKVDGSITPKTDADKSDIIEIKDDDDEPVADKSTEETPKASSVADGSETGKSEVKSMEDI